MSAVFGTQRTEGRALLSLARGGEIRAIVETIEDRALPGESLSVTFRRLVQARDLAIYDRSVVMNARTEARLMRFAFAAAILSNPKKELRITHAAQQSIMGPGDKIAIVELKDMATGEVIYRIKDADEDKADTRSDRQGARNGSLDTPARESGTGRSG